MGTDPQGQQDPLFLTRPTVTLRHTRPIPSPWVGYFRLRPS